MKRTIVLAGLLAVALFAAAPASAQTPINPNKTAKLAWNIAAPDLASAGGYQYAIYVDGTRQVLPGSTCTAAEPGDFACSAPLPALTQGVHVLELTAAEVIDGEPIESGKSLPLSIRVVVAPATPRILRIGF